MYLCVTEILKELSREKLDYRYVTVGLSDCCQTGLDAKRGGRIIIVASRIDRCFH